MNKQLHKSRPLSLTWKLALISSVLLMFVDQLHATHPELDNGVKIDLQQNRVTGQVFSGGGEPLVGVTVTEQNTNNSTMTDEKGEFTLNVQSNASILVFSYVGYESTEIVASQASRVELSSSSDDIEEVVVVGFGRQSKATLTTSVSQIDSKVLQDRPAVTAANMIQGAAPGLVVTRSSGRVGNQGLNISVRGATSANGDVPPLIVIDGVVSNQTTFMSLNPSDIENISVLKDGGATAIYGAQSAGGVLLVTTKRGTSGKARITLSSNTGFSTPMNLPQRLSLIDEMNYVNLARQNAGVGDEYTEEDLNYAVNGPEFVLGPNGQWRTYNQRSLIDQVIKKQYTLLNNNLQIAGGSDHLTYMVSLGNMTQEGLFKVGEDEMSRWNTRVNLSAKINNYLSLDYNGAVIHQSFNLPQDGGYSIEGGGNGILRQLYTSRGRFPIYNEDGTYYRSGTSSAFGYALLKDGGFNRDRNMNYMNNVTLNIGNFVEGLDFSVLYGREDIGQESRNFRRTVTYYSGPTEATASWLNDPNNYEITKYNTLRENIQATGNYDFSLGAHNFHIMGAYQVIKYDYDYIRATTRNLFVNDNPSLNFTSDPLNKSHVQYERSDIMQSYVGRFRYNYDMKYLFEATIRSDESSRLTSGDRVKLFPSFSAGWNIARESWFDGISHIVNDLKPRISWGKVGSNVGIGFYDHIGQLTSASNIVLGGNRQTYVYQNSLPATILGWETIETRNFALDFSFLNRKLSGSFEYYNKFNNNMLVSISLPGTIGINIPRTNDGKLKTWGWDFDLSYRDRLNQDFSYGVSLNIADNKNRLVQYGGANNVVNSGVNQLVEGYALNSIWGYRTDGYFQTQQELDNAPSYTRLLNNVLVPGLGDVRYVDVNGDGEISPGLNTLEDSGDLVYLGDINPRYQYGLNLDFRYKNLDFSMFVQGIGKRNFKPSNELLQPQIQSWYQPLNIHMDYWTPDNRDAAFPRPFLSGNHNFQNSDMWFLSGAYTRLKNIQLGYTFNKETFTRFPFSNLRIYFSGEDLFTISRMGVFKGAIDPEQPQNSISAYPFAKTFSFGLNLTL